MAITLEQFLDLDQQKKNDLQNNIRRLSGYISDVKDRIVSANRPFTGKLEENYNALLDAMSTLTGQNEAPEKTEAALKTMDNLGGFLNLNIGPGKITVRDAMMSGKNAESKDEINEIMTSVGNSLQINTAPEAAPLFNYRRENERRSANLDEIEKGKYRKIGNSLHALANEYKRSVESFTPAEAEQAKEIVDYAAAFSAVDSDLLTTIQYNMNTEGVKSEYKAEYRAEDAYQKILSGADSFLKKKIKVGDREITPEEWLRQDKGRYFGYTENPEKPLADLKRDMNLTIPAADIEKTERADQKIEGLLRPIRNGREATLEDVCAIFAVRIAADAQRNNLKELKKTMVSPREVQAIQQKLLNNKSMQEFFSRHKNEITALASSQRTHGGAIEDKFKTFLLNRPAGEMENQTEFSRYMPTAEERIDVLKKQIKRAESDEEKRTAMAEIVTLRNMVHAERNTGRGLEKTIPTDSSSSLQKSTEVLSYRRGFSNIAADVEKYAAKGHGGKMVDEMRKLMKDPGNVYADDEIASALLNRNTYQGRVSEIKAEAMDMLDRLNTDPASCASMKGKFKDLSLELFGICDSQKNQGKKPLSNIDYQDVKYRVGAVHVSEVDADKLDIDLKTMKQGLTNMIQTKNFNFTIGSTLREKKNTVEKQIQAPEEANVIQP